MAKFKKGDIIRWSDKYFVEENWGEIMEVKGKKKDYEDAITFKTLAPPSTRHFRGSDEWDFETEFVLLRRK